MYRFFIMWVFNLYNSKGFFLVIGARWGGVGWGGTILDHKCLILVLSYLQNGVALYEAEVTQIGLGWGGGIWYLKLDSSIIDEIEMRFKKEKEKSGHQWKHWEKKRHVYIYIYITLRTRWVCAGKTHSSSMGKKIMRCTAKRWNRTSQVLSNIDNCWYTYRQSHSMHCLWTRLVSVLLFINVWQK